VKAEIEKIASSPDERALHKNRERLWCSREQRKTSKQGDLCGDMNDTELEKQEERGGKKTETKRRTKIIKLCTRHGESERVSEPTANEVK
jgi:hypothetical protein